MTMPHEEMRTLINVRAFLRDLLWKKGRIEKKWLREHIYRLLRHYPFDYKIEKMYSEAKMDRIEKIAVDEYCQELTVTRKELYPIGGNKGKKSKTIPKEV